MHVTLLLPVDPISSCSAVKATDENQTSENWEIILNLCDKVQDEGEQGSDFYLRWQQCPHAHSIMRTQGP